MPWPGPHAIFLLLLTPAAFYLFTRDRIPIASTAFGLLVVLVLTFEVFPFKQPGHSFAAREVFAGFGNEALVTICALMLLGRGLMLTGALEPVARFVAYLWRFSARGAMLFVLALTMVASGVLNDTPIVVLMIPILKGVAERTHARVSKMLLPMNYSVLIGGMATTIGTSTNILVVSIATGLGLRQFEIFEFAGITALAAIPALIYLWLIVPFLLPDLETESLQRLRLYDAWLHVPDDHDIEGISLADLRGKKAPGIRILEIKRGKIFLARLPTMTIQPGDHLLVRDTRENLKRFSDELKMPLHSLDEEALEDTEVGGEAAADLQLAELVVSENATLVGSTIRAERLAERSGLIVLGLRAAHQQLTTKPEIIGDTVIHPGDVLLVQGSIAVLEAVKHSGEFLVLDGATTLPRSKKAPTALAIMAMVVVSASTGLVHISIASVVGAFLMLVTSCINWDDVGQGLSSRIVLIVVASLALGEAMTATGATNFLASAYLNVSGTLPPQVVLSSLMLLMALLTNFVSNNAAAAIGTPVAFGIATQLGVSPEPFVLAVLFGANLCYLTPMGYQTNMLVMGAAGYRFRDFVVCGFPLLVIMWAMYSWILPKVYPLAP